MAVSADASHSQNRPRWARHGHPACRVPKRLGARIGVGSIVRGADQDGVPIPRVGRGWIVLAPIPFHAAGDDRRDLPELRSGPACSRIWRTSRRSAPTGAPGSTRARGPTFRARMTGWPVFDQVTAMTRLPSGMSSRIASASASSGMVRKCQTVLSPEEESHHRGGGSYPALCRELSEGDRRRRHRKDQGEGREIARR